MPTRFFVLRICRIIEHNRKRHMLGNDFSVVTTAPNNCLSEIKESLMIYRKKSEFNKNITSSPLLGIFRMWSTTISVY